MLKELVTIIFSNNIILEDCLKNGSYFLTKNDVIITDIFKNNIFDAEIKTTLIDTKTKSQNIFIDKINNIKISDEILKLEYYDTSDYSEDPVSLGEFYWFKIDQIPDSEIMKMELEAKLNYIAMMSDIDLED